MQIGTSRIIDGDLFGIAAQLRAVDPSYYVVENYKKRRLELHSSAQRGSTLALVLPYRVLDGRAVRHVLRTRSERIRELIAEADRDNAALAQKEFEKTGKKIEREIEHAYCNL